MKELEPEASRRLARYLDQVRATLRGAHTVDAEEVEADVAAHIQSELASLPAPVPLSALDHVLERLGSPSRWVPAEEISPLLRALQRLKAGPEDWRLAYLCLLCFLLAIPIAASGLGPLAFVLILGSYLAARAVLTLTDGEGEELGARRWLVHPVLLAVHGVLLASLIAAPLVLALAAAGELADLEAVRPRLPEVAAKHVFLLQRVVEADDPIDLLIAAKKAGHVLLAVIGPWLLLLGLVARRFPGWPARLFRPLLDRLGGATARILTWTGAALTGLALVAYLVNG